MLLTITFNNLLLIIACLIDYLVGDPIGWFHPVQAIGWIISLGKKIGINQQLQPRFSPLTMKLWGIFLGIFVMIGTATIGYGLVLLGYGFHPFLGHLVEIIFLSACLAGKSLRVAAMNVLKVLADLPNARQVLSYYVGRDTAELSEQEILRAVLETVTENGVDGVTAPLFYAMVGHLFFPDFGGMVFALFYKASSTLDSMIGYKEAPFTDLGWFSAKTEDCLTWLPCRLTVFTLGLLSSRPFYVWRICQRDAVFDPSPNSGWSECVYAAILDVQLGGENRYQGKTKFKHLLGNALVPITSAKIYQALDLTRSCCLVWLFIFYLMLFFQSPQSFLQYFNLIAIFF